MPKLFTYLTDTKKLRKFMDWMAYASLVMDVLIAIITSLSLFLSFHLNKYLLDVDIMLTAIVVLSISSGLLMIWSKIYENRFFKALRKEMKWNKYNYR